MRVMLLLEKDLVFLMPCMNDQFYLAVSSPAGPGKFPSSDKALMPWQAYLCFNSLYPPISPIPALLAILHSITAASCHIHHPNWSSLPSSSFSSWPGSRCWARCAALGCMWQVCQGGPAFSAKGSGVEPVEAVGWECRSSICGCTRLLEGV